MSASTREDKLDHSVLLGFAVLAKVYQYYVVTEQLMQLKSNACNAKLGPLYVKGEMIKFQIQVIDFCTGIAQPDHLIKQV